MPNTKILKRENENKNVDVGKIRQSFYDLDLGLDALIYLAYEEKMQQRGERKKGVDNILL